VRLSFSREQLADLINRKSPFPNAAPHSTNVKPALENNAGKIYTYLLTMVTCLTNAANANEIAADMLPVMMNFMNG